jgi:hypothetical protein
MSQEKPNESLHWKNTLDDLDHLPGEQIQDKNASWRKLHDRLREKPHHKKTIWYWTAAASVLLVAGLQWINMHQKDVRIVNDKTQPVPENASKKIEMVHADTVKNAETTVMDAETIIVEGRREAPATVKNKGRSMQISAPLLKNEPDSVIVKESLPEIITTIDNRTSDTIAIVASLPVKKKLRVIHINNLGTSADEKIQFSRNASSTAFQGKLFNQDGFKNFSLSKNASDDLVKIKLSPSN